jgi:hypothetical protein
MNFRIQLPESGRIVDITAEFDGYECLGYIINDPKDFSIIDPQSLPELDRYTLLEEINFRNCEEIDLEDIYNDTYHSHDTDSLPPEQ